MRNHMTYVMMIRTESRSIKVNKTIDILSMTKRVVFIYHMKLIFSKAFKDRLVLYISDIDLSPGDCEL